MTDKQLCGALEAVLFASGDPIGLDKLREALQVTELELRVAVGTLREKYGAPESGVRLLELEDSLQLATDPAYIEPVRAALELRKNTPLSQAAMEVLALVAYNEPVTKSFIEQVRGVDSSGVVGSLVAKGLLEERGRLELPGRPLLYGTTENFLRCMQIRSLSELPPLPRNEEEPEHLPDADAPFADENLENIAPGNGAAEP